MVIPQAKGKYKNLQWKIQMKRTEEVLWVGLRMWRDKYGEIRLITHHWQQVHIRPGLFYHNSIDLQNMTRGGGFSVSRWRTGLLKRGKKCLKLFLCIYIAGVELRSASSGKLPHFMSALWKVLTCFKSARLKNLLMLFIIYCYRLPLLLLFGTHFHQGKTRKN